MREEQQSISKRRTTKGRKTLVVFGILFIIAGVFLGSFACSFQMMIQAANAAQADEGTLENENKKLREDVQLLQDQVTVLQTELERYKGTSSSARPASSSSARPTNSTSAR